MVLLSEKQQRDLLIVAGLADFLVGGKLTAAARTAVVAALRRMGPTAARGAVGLVPSVARTVGMVAMRHPYVAAGAVIYVAVTEREKIRTLLEQGYDVIEERLPTPSLPSPGPIPGVEEIITGGMIRPPSFIPRPSVEEVLKGFDPMTMLRRKRKPSAFNKAVSAGMKAIKKSTSYGKRGVIKPAKKAFALVTKLAAAKKKKKKAPKSGIRRKVWNAMKGLR
jgi:hypothetical protein